MKLRWIIQLKNKVYNEHRKMKIEATIDSTMNASWIEGYKNIGLPSVSPPKAGGSVYIRYTIPVWRRNKITNISIIPIDLPGKGISIFGSDISGNLIFLAKIDRIIPANSINASQDNSVR